MPRYSRRAMLASLATGGGIGVFNENVANRLWAMMMGRGLVHPLDLHHPSNPPSHPELMTLLGEEIAALKFDVEPFLRELALTRAYQSAIDLPADAPPLPDCSPPSSPSSSRDEPLEAAAEQARGGYRHGGQGLASRRGRADPAGRRAGEGDRQARRGGEEGGCGPEGRRRRGGRASSARRDTAKALADVAGPDAGRSSRNCRRRKSWPTPRVSSPIAPRPPRPNWRHWRKRAARRPPLSRKSARSALRSTKIVEAARARIRQVRESVRREEAVVLEARRKLAERRATLENHQRRLGRTEAYARWHGLRRPIDAQSSRGGSPHRPSPRPRSDAAEQAAVVTNAGGRGESAGRPGADRRPRAAADAEAALERHQKAATSVDAALAATRGRSGTPTRRCGPGRGRPEAQGQGGRAPIGLRRT